MNKKRIRYRRYVLETFCKYCLQVVKELSVSFRWQIGRKMFSLYTLSICTSYIITDRAYFKGLGLKENRTDFKVWLV